MVKLQKLFYLKPGAERKASLNGSGRGRQILESKARQGYAEKSCLRNKERGREGGGREVKGREVDRQTPWQENRGREKRWRRVRAVLIHTYENITIKPIILYIKKPTMFANNKLLSPIFETGYYFYHVA